MYCVHSGPNRRRMQPALVSTFGGSQVNGLVPTSEGGVLPLMVLSVIVWLRLTQLTGAEGGKP